MCLLYLNLSAKNLKLAQLKEIEDFWITNLQYNEQERIIWDKLNDKTK